MLKQGHATGAASSRIIGGLVLAYGLVLVYDGVDLLRLGGTAYYAVAGLVTALAGGLTLSRRSGPIAIYAGLLVATLAWALNEAGTEAWLLLPRLGGPLLVGAILCIPRLSARQLGLGAVAVVAALGIGILAATWDPKAVPSVQQSSDSNGVLDAASGDSTNAGDWLHYGGGLSGTRFSMMSGITPANVGDLRQAWHFETGEDPAKAPDAHNLPAFESTPLEVDGKLFLCTPRNQVIALDAQSGREIWRFNPQTQTKGNFYLVTCRGVAYFVAPPGTKECPRRIIGATMDSRLFALDAATGALCDHFGDHGMVFLKEHIGDIPPGFYGVTSAPTVAGGLIVVGGLVLDNQSVDVPSGVVRAFDAITGLQRWAWDSGRPSGSSIPKDGIYTRGSPNAWAPFSVDETLGLIYLPTGNASPDYYGGLRSGAKDRYASSVVALDLATGAVRWSFQTVHHDLWDYDVASQPTLVDLPISGRTVPALVQTTKRGDIFILDRRTGQPLTGIEERPAPGGAAPGDHVAPTQPFAVGMPSLAPPPLTEQSMWGVTPFDQVWCRKQFLTARYDGPFTPPSERGSISFPNNMGASNWGGLSVDPVRKIAIANTSYVASTIKLFSRAEADRRVAAGEPVYNPQTGTPYAVDALPLVSPIGIPCNQPPWGLLSAIDLESRRLIWQKPFGTTAFRAPFGLAIPLGLPSSGGALVTTTGLTIIGAADDAMLRIFETRSGRLLWSAKLPAAANATPMTYLAPDGRQYIVVAAGGHTYLGNARGDHVMAFALPATSTQKPVDAGSR